MILSALLQNVDWTLLYGEEKEINKITYDLYIFETLHKKYEIFLLFCNIFIHIFCL